MEDIQGGKGIQRNRLLDKIGKGILGRRNSLCQSSVGGVARECLNVFRAQNRGQWGWSRIRRI